MLIRRLARASRLACVCVVALVVSSCGSDHVFDPDLPIVGHYVATDFRVAPLNTATVDVLARGGSIVLDITADNKTTGELVVPANIFGVELRQSLNGTAARAGNNLTLSHTPATFLTQLIFGVYEKVLFVGAQSIDGGNAGVTITLTRQ